MRSMKYGARLVVGSLFVFLMAAAALPVNGAVTNTVDFTTTMDMDFMGVGNTGNVAETSGIGAQGWNSSWGPTEGYSPINRGTTTNAGSVGYIYGIGKHEVTVGQYVEFLNAVATNEDTYGLYNTNMGRDVSGDMMVKASLSRFGSSGSYSYSAMTGTTNYPIIWASWGSAARFANWLSNEKPTGNQDATTTERGTYTLDGTNDDTGLMNIDRIASLSPTKTYYCIPTENEWYKAAYYNKGVDTGGGSNSTLYWDYPTMSNAKEPTQWSWPGRDKTEATNPGTNANFLRSDGTSYLNNPEGRTAVGEFELSAGPYGTFDMGGNVWEWTETKYNSGSRLQRGGAWGTDSTGSAGLGAPFRLQYEGPVATNGCLGFRLSVLLATQVAVPAVSNTAPTNITWGSACLNGNLTVTGGAPTFVWLYWGDSDGQNTNANWAHTNSFGQQGKGVLTTNISPLIPGTTYYYRYYATNSAGTTWASPSSNFTTVAAAPAVTNTAATNITWSSAFMNGSLTSTGSTTTFVWLYWGNNDGQNTNINWTHTNAFGQMNAGTLTTNITGLSPLTPYYYRYYATNSAGLVWASPSGSFTTETAAATIANIASTNILWNSASMNGNLINTGGAPTFVWLYWGDNDGQNTNANWAHTNSFGQMGMGLLTTNIAGLSASTPYYYRYYATNSAGATWTSPSTNFVTLPQPTVPIITNTSPSSIGTIAAYMNGNLVNTGGAPTFVWLYWGDNDGQDTNANWAHTNYFGQKRQWLLTTNITGLTPATTYYYRYYATNFAGPAWASPSRSFMTQVDGPTNLVVHFTTTVDMVFVGVGDTNNAAETSGVGAQGWNSSWGPTEGYSPINRGTTTNTGSVGYSYLIGKYEVTVGQYVEFLNAVAKTDTYGLYNSNMGQDIGGDMWIRSSLTRSGSPGSYSYAVVTGKTNYPIIWVSWGSAARFANWLSNEKPTGDQNTNTTERGTYTLDGTNDATGLMNMDRIANPDSTKTYYCIPTEDEWYKAAYYNKGVDTGGGSNSTLYWDYPTMSNAKEPTQWSWPGRDKTEATNPGTNANFLRSDGTSYLNNPEGRTAVGEFELSAGPYGTFDMGGNVWEWTETKYNSGSRLQRGGAWGTDSTGSAGLGAPFRLQYEGPTATNGCLGFRLSVLQGKPAQQGSLIVLGAR